ncbi:hypothetical protein AOLI_G00119940 [Acnodon oligacanthus]
MTRVQLLMVFFLLLLTDSVFSNKVQQIPPDVIKARGDSVEIQCLHSIPSYNRLSDVIQNPSRLFASQGSSVQLKCDHTLGSSYYQMYWYRQEQVSLTQIVYTVANTKPDFGSFSEEKYSAEKNNYASGSLTVKNLTADDSGSYFCVVSMHSERHRWNC